MTWLIHSRVLACHITTHGLSQVAFRQDKAMLLQTHIVGVLWMHLTVDHEQYIKMCLLTKFGSDSRLLREA